MKEVLERVPFADLFLGLSLEEAKYGFIPGEMFSSVVDKIILASQLLGAPIVIPIGYETGEVTIRVTPGMTSNDVLKAYDEGVALKRSEQKNRKYTKRVHDLPEDWYLHVKPEEQ